MQRIDQDYSRLNWVQKAVVNVYAWVQALICRDYQSSYEYMVTVFTPAEVPPLARNVNGVAAPLLQPETRELRVEKSYQKLLSWPTDIDPMVTHLDLSGNEGLKLPDELQHYAKLVELKLSITLTDDLSQICKLHTLEVLDVSYSWVKALPIEISQLKNLRILKLNGNMLSLATLPDMRSCTKLEEIDLGMNKITELPDWIYNLPSNVVIYLQSNKLGVETVEKINKHKEKNLGPKFIL